jgi:hypothetical protein
MIDTLFYGMIQYSTRVQYCTVVQYHRKAKQDLFSFPTTIIIVITNLHHSQLQNKGNNGD